MKKQKLSEDLSLYSYDGNLFENTKELHTYINMKMYEQVDVVGNFNVNDFESYKSVKKAMKSLKKHMKAYENVANIKKNNIWRND